MVHLIFPNSMIVYHPDYISHLGMFPAAADETLFVHTMLTPETPLDEKAETHADGYGRLQRRGPRRLRADPARPLKRRE